MKWKSFDLLQRLDEAKRRRLARQSDWHPWFAWHWVKLTDKNETVWLTTIFRKGKECMVDCDTWMHWQYAENVFDILKT
jgi:hypothetical protein